MSCDKNPQNVEALNPRKTELHPLTNKTVSRATPTLFEPKQVHPAKSSFTFNSQEAGAFYNVELPNFWNRIFFPKHLDKIQKLSGKALSFDL